MGVSERAVDLYRFSICLLGSDGIACLLDVSRFTIRTMARRLASMKYDPLLGALTDSPDIRVGLEELAVQFSSASR